VVLQLKWEFIYATIIVMYLARYNQLYHPLQMRGDPWKPTSTGMIMDIYSYVYIMASKKNGTLYVGITSDLIRRTWEHRNHLVPGFTKKYDCSLLVYYEQHLDIYEGNRREKRLKKYLRKWKIRLIESKNPQWKDLFEDICG
jgi:putative endonuclease